MKDRTYIVRLNHIYGIGVDRKAECRVLTGVFITNCRGHKVIDARGEFFAYQRMEPDSYFDIHLDGQWYDKDSKEAKRIVSRHWEDDNF